MMETHNFASQNEPEVAMQHSYRQLLQKLRKAFPQPVSDPVHDAYMVFSIQKALDGHGRVRADDVPTKEKAVAARPRHPGTPTEAELRELLDRHRGNIAAVGRELGKERMQVHRWLKRYGIDVAAYRS